MTYGTIYSGVPQIVKFLPSFIIFAKSKSVNLKNPSFSINKFSGFKSLKIIFFPCKYSKQSATVAV
jgi:hypothetical protein